MFLFTNMDFGHIFYNTKLTQPYYVKDNVQVKGLKQFIEYLTTVGIRKFKY